MSSAGAPRWSRWIQSGAAGSRVTRLELFYDLVFVFAFLNVTNLVGDTLTGTALLYGLLVFAMLWWCWTSFAALGNAIRADQGVIPLVGFATMAAVFLLALSTPEAFVDHPGGLPGPIVFASCYLLVRALQVAVFWVVVRSTPDLRRRWLLSAAPVLVSGALIITAAVVPQRLFDGSTEVLVRTALWMVALVVEYGAGALLGSAGWTVVSAGHWAERYALIVLVALGESIISLGLGSSLSPRTSITWPLIIAAVLGIAVIASLWWSYFDAPALAVEQVLHRTRDPAARVRLARDAYTYLHLPMITGIILFALGLKRHLGDIAKSPSAGWQHRVGGIELYVLFGGVLLYLLALGFLVLRADHRRLRPRPLVWVVLVALLVTVALRPPALIALGLLAAGCTTLAVLQLLNRNLRDQVRRTALDEQRAVEADQSHWRGRNL